MKLLITAFALFLSVCSFGQNDLRVQTNEIAQINDLENLVRAWNTSYNTVNIEEEVDGSAYLDTQFTKGIVALTTGVKYADIPLRYNIYNDLIEFRNQKGKVFNINNPSAIKELTIGESRFIYTDCKLHKKSIKLFAEVIAEGNVSLLKHHRIKLQPAKPAEIHKVSQPPKFVKISSEYLIKRGDENVRLFKNKKELLSLLLDKSKGISELISSEKLSVSRESDLVRIIDYYNSH